MPVILEPITAPTEQDLLDLEKIYADFPGDLRWPEVEQKLRANPAMNLYGALFNGRLIGAVAITARGDEADIDYLCVRTVTRRRGVGREIIRQLLAKTLFNSFSLVTDSDNKALAQFLDHTGFNHDGHRFTLIR